ncbi:MAG TPA: hypothetical protein VF219_09705, partial [Vicinamibacterales bacterium]
MRLSDEARKRLWDISAAGRMIVDWTTKTSVDDYNASPLLRAAVERAFIIIGEALRIALGLEQSLTMAITDAPKIVGFRNV